MSIMEIFNVCSGDIFKSVLEIFGECPVDIYLVSWRYLMGVPEIFDGYPGDNRWVS